MLSSSAYSFEPWSTVGMTSSRHASYLCYAVDGRSRSVSNRLCSALPRIDSLGLLVIRSAFPRRLEVQNQFIFHGALFAYDDFTLAFFTVQVPCVNSGCVSYQYVWSQNSCVSYVTFLFDIAGRLNSLELLHAAMRHGSHRNRFRLYAHGVMLFWILRWFWNVRD
jgi:hypothetical protein